MKDLLTTNYNKYMELEFWKKVLLFLPFVILIIGLAAWVFLSDSNSKDKYIESIKNKKNKVDKKIIENQNKQKELDQLENKALNRQEELNKEIKDKYEEAKQIEKDINYALSNDDIEHLKLLHAKLNSKSRRR